MKRVFVILGFTILLSATLIGLAVTKEAAKDPVCGMEVDTATASITFQGDSGTVYFCSEHCKTAFCANPSAYLDAEKLEKIGIKSAEEAIGCGGCAVMDVSEKKGCDGQCGDTKVAALNEFHSVLHALEAAVASGKTEAVKADLVVFAEKKDAVMKAECPDGVCMHSFNGAQAEFGEKSDAFLTVCKGDDPDAIKTAFAEMHEAYGTLDQAAR
jgi:YHS domain-containing protein